MKDNITKTTQYHNPSGSVYIRKRNRAGTTIELSKKLAKQLGIEFTVQGEVVLIKGSNYIYRELAK